MLDCSQAVKAAECAQGAMWSCFCHRDNALILSCRLLFILEIFQSIVLAIDPYHCRADDFDLIRTDGQVICAVELPSLELADAQKGRIILRKQCFRLKNDLDNQLKARAVKRVPTS